MLIHKIFRLLQAMQFVHSAHWHTSCKTSEINDQEAQECTKIRNVNKSQQALCMYVCLCVRLYGFELIKWSTPFEAFEAGDEIVMPTTNKETLQRAKCQEENIVCCTTTNINTYILCYKVFVCLYSATLVCHITCGRSRRCSRKAINTRFATC